MKKIFVVLGVLLATYILWGYQSVRANEIGYISVNVTETKEIAPNTADIVFSVETTDVNSKNAVERNNQITNKVISALKNELISDKKSTIQTKSFNLRPNYKYNEVDVKSIKNYTATNSIEVKTTDVSKVSALMEVAIKNNVSKVGSLNFSIEDNDDLLTELINKAVDKARTTARKASLAANQKLGTVKSMRVNIYQQNSNGSRLYQTSATSDKAAVSDTLVPVETGKIKLNVSVDAEFYVK